ncbi:putative membrane protein At3g27390 [Wolffia australiana]
MVQLRSAEAAESAKKGLWVAYVVFAFCCALVLGFFKGLMIGPMAAIVIIAGNVGVLVGLFPAHVYWTVLTIIETSAVSAMLKIVLLLSLPVVFVLWLAVGCAGSVFVGLGYGFVSPWMATFDAFRLEGERNKFLHCIVDGTWGTIKGSCTVVRDFADFSFHSIPVYLKELRDAEEDPQPLRIRFVDVPACILVAIVGIIVDLPLYTLIAIVKSPYMLFKGWQRLLQDLISGKGPFQETSCVPIAGLAILFWPVAVIGCIILAFFAGIFFGLYGAVIVYQERSLRRGLAYVVATVAEFDEYTNDWLYLSEGTYFPRPQYRKRKVSDSMELSVRPEAPKAEKAFSGPLQPPALLVPNLAPSRSVREVIREVKMVQIWDEMMTACEDGGKLLINAGVITLTDLIDWGKVKGNNGGIVGVGLPAFCLLDIVMDSIKSGHCGIMLSNGEEINYLNRPQDRLLDWFFHPVMVLKEQVKVINLNVGELRFLEKLVIFGNDKQRMESWHNGAVVPKDALRNAQIQAISRRLVGMAGSISKIPTYRRIFQRVVKVLTAHALGKENPEISDGSSFISVGNIRIPKPSKDHVSIEAMHAEV